MLAIQKKDIPLGISVVGAIFCKILWVLEIWDFAFIPGFLFEILAGLLYSIRIFSKKNTAWSNAKYFFIIIWTICGLIRIFEYGNQFFSMIRTLSFWGWVLILGIENLRRSQSTERLRDRIQNILFVAGSVCIILGVTLKVSHIAAGNYFLYIGIAIGAYWILSEFVKKK